MSPMLAFTNVSDQWLTRSMHKTKQRYCYHVQCIELGELNSA